MYGTLLVIIQVVMGSVNLDIGRETWKRNRDLEITGEYIDGR